MSTRLNHEDFKDLLGRLVNAITDDLPSPAAAAGRRPGSDEAIKRGIEADLCYYFDGEKLAIVNQSRARKVEKDIADYPNPDLATEIDISPPQIDRPSIYAAPAGCRTLAVRRRIDEIRAARSGWEVCPGRLEPFPADSARGSRTLGRRGEHGRSRGMACTVAPVDPGRAGAAADQHAPAAQQHSPARAPKRGR